VTGLRVAFAVLALAAGKLTIAGGPDGIVIRTQPPRAGVQLHWRVHQSDGTGESGISKTGPSGRIVVPVTGDALVTGTVDVSGVGTRAHAVFCLDPHDVAVVHGRCFGNFAGSWSGDYTGTYFGQNGCKDWPIDGPVQLKLHQSGRRLTGTITTGGSALQWDGECQIIGRDQDIANVNATVSGRTASGGSLTLSIDDDLASLHGAVNAVAGTLTFTAQRY
jgi:hypothetical protein